MTTPSPSFSRDQVIAAMRANLAAEGGDVWLDGVTYTNQELIAALDAGTGAVLETLLSYLSLYAQQEPVEFAELIDTGLRRTAP